MRRQLVVIGIILSLVLSAYSQDKSKVNRYFVYFKTKAETSGYPYSLDRPEEFLSQRALDRRSKQGILVKEADLPVHPSFVSSLSSAGAEVFFSSRWLNGSLVNLDTARLDEIIALDFVDSIAWLADSTRLSFNHPDYTRPDTFKDPISFSSNSDIQLAMLGADVMHKDNIKGQNMLIAVFDNGYKGVDTFTPFQHIWEEGRFVAMRDFVTHAENVFASGSHGTAVLSTMAANASDGENALTGVAPLAAYVLCITEDNKGENVVEEYNWLLAAEYADSLGADVINGSVGYRLFDIVAHDHVFSSLDGSTTISSIAATMAAQRGMIVAVSAGNEGDKGWKYITTPADARRILTVGSVDMDFSRSPFSSVGNTADGRIKPDIAAFGNGTAVMSGNGSITRLSGTSFASPLIAGFAACIWQANPDRTYHEVIAAIKNSGHQSDSPDSLLGYGVPNYLYARDVKALSTADIFEDKVTVYPNPFQGDKLYIHTSGEFRKGMYIRLLDPEGKLIYKKRLKRREVKEEMELSIDSSVQGVYFLFLQTDTQQKIVKLINF